MDQCGGVKVRIGVVNNALEAAGYEKPIRLRLGQTGGKIRVGIEDQGPGMSAEFIRDRLFKPLSSTKGSGFGIGTYQAREIMRELGGSIDVSSVPGQGTTMILVLPAATAAGGAPILESEEAR